MNTKTRLPVCLLLAILAACSGCSNKDANRNAVDGEVTLDGKPVEQGSILFIPVDGTEGAATGGPIQAGHYRISKTQGAATGWNRVEIHAVRKTGKMIPKGFGTTGEMIDEQVDIAPPRYNSASILKTEVTPDKNTANFDLTTQ